MLAQVNKISGLTGYSRRSSGAVTLLSRARVLVRVLGLRGIFLQLSRGSRGVRFSA